MRTQKSCLDFFQPVMVVQHDKYLCHKCHINKVMAVTFTTYAFDSNVKNGGHGIKLGLYHVQAAHVAQQDVRQSRHNEDRNL
jgi:hypothetical protein